MEKVIRIFLIVFSIGSLLIISNLFGRNDVSPKVPRESLTLDENVRKKSNGSFIRLSDGYTHYEDTGDKNAETIVFIHGGSLASWIWDKQIDYFRNKGFRVIRYDQYGRGFSDRPEINYTRDMYIKQLYELLDKLKINRKAVLVGHSFGGMITSSFASKYPEKVKKAVYVAPVIKFPGLAVWLLKSRFGDWYVKRNLDRIHITIDARLNNLNIPLDPYKEIFLQQTQYKGYEYSMLSMFDYSLDDYRSIYKEAGEKIEDHFIVWGTGDNIISEKQIKEYKELIPKSKLEIITNAGHAVQFEKYEIVNRMIHEFIR